MRERFLTGYNDFVLPFMIGMIFILSYCVIGLVRIILQLPKEDRKKFFISLVTPKTIAKNIRDIFCDCLFHVKLWKRNKLLGYMHSSIAFGWFMLIVIGHIEVFLYVPHRAKLFYYPIFFRYFVAETESTMRGAFFFFLMDFFLLMVLSGIFLAMFKRIQSKVFGMRRTTNPSFLDLVGLYSLWAIFPLRLLAEGFTADISGGSFLTKSLNYVLNSFLSDHTNMLPAWWAYSCALGVFFIVLPFTRYMHIPAEILLIPLRNAGIRIKNARKGFAKAEVYSCPNCGLCIDACPMGVMKTHIKDTTVYLNRQIRRGNEKRIEEISDKCLLCGKCTAICPVGVEGDKLRIAQRSIRRYALNPDYSNISTSLLPVSDGNRDAVKPAGEEKVLYYAGCMTALTPVIRKAMESLLTKAGVRYDLMDKDGGLCCGRPMMMAGRLDQARQMIDKNTEIIMSSGAHTLLLTCPICYRIFKEKYILPGIEVIHHTEYLARLISDGKLKIKKDDARYVFHDPCELGRGCGIYEQPREALSFAGNVVEAAKNRKESICCGGSLGSLTLGFEKRKAMTENALSNLVVQSPDVIVTACPLCRSTFSRYADRPVEDIAEIIDHKTLIS
ncbi:MAG: 4Fe-4S dicluster domain-containing protein [Bacteroidetes bacterium]|uniref:4Fe-4S dicluster domain-containing protein n=1 Tax=Candidatus Cryptobacteroides excrementavium TaxID=2840759 RepID=A0A9D9J4J4_9BACT|nr:4Fe-4S dicluster domain-containing protein [Candidatus Cryptobacteroides excrementavium]